MGLYPYNTEDPSSNSELCLKWVDKNTSSGAVVVHSGCTFNIEDPGFYLPMTVMSGLASGFCERMAVAKLAVQNDVVVSGSTIALGTVTGGTTAAVWVCGAGPDDSAYADNSQIAANVASNLALTNTQDIYFQPSSSPIFTPPFKATASSAGKAGNYIAAFDSALQTMLDIGIYKTNSKGDTAFGFTTLAASASSAAAAASSSLPFTPTVSGGAQYTSDMRLAYPAQWAKERKWMMDQLRYTGPTDTMPMIDLRASWLSAAGYSGTTIPALYSAVVSGAVVNSGRTNFDRKEYADLIGKQTTINSVTQDGTANIPYGIIGHINSNLAIGTEVATTVYLGTDGHGGTVEPWEETGTPINDDAGMPVDGATITAAGNYTVLPGRTVTFVGTTAKPIDLHSLSISAGAVAIVSCGTALVNGSQTVRIQSCNIMDGGGYLQDTMSAGSTYTDARQHTTYAYMPVDTPPSVLSNTGPTFAYITTGSYTGASNAMIAGGTVTRPSTAGGSPEVRIVSGGVLINQGSVQKALVGPGGKCINNASSMPYVSVFAGGHLELHSGERMDIEIFSGGTLTIASNWTNSDRGIETLILHQGASVNVPAAAAATGFVHDIIYRTFHTYGLKTSDGVSPLSSGWNLLRGSVYAGDGNTGCFCRLTPEITAATAKTNANNDQPATLETAFGSATVNWLQNADRKTYIYECSPLAINGSLPCAGPQADHYTDFRVRQFPT